MNASYKFMLFSLIYAGAAAYAQGQVIPQAGEEVGQVDQFSDSTAIDAGADTSSLYGESLDNSGLEDQAADEQGWTERASRRKKPGEINIMIGRDNSKHAQMQIYCRAYAPRSDSSQNCQSIAAEVFGRLDNNMRLYVKNLLDERCRTSYSDSCLLKRLELVALIKNARNIRACGQAVLGYNPDQEIKPLFNKRISCTAVYPNSKRALRFYTLDYGQVKQIINFSKPMYDGPQEPPHILPPYNGDIRPTDNQLNELGGPVQDAGTSN